MTSVFWSASIVFLHIWQTGPNIFNTYAQACSSPEHWDITMLDVSTAAVKSNVSTSATFVSLLGFGCVRKDFKSFNNI